MFWAWERPTDLKQAPPNSGVAFLASTIHLHAGNVRIAPRFQPLVLRPDVYRLAVIRIESDGAGRGNVAKAIVDTALVTRADGVQIDFDATQSERPFYLRMIRDVRSRLGPKMFLSITALVSWCGSKSWMDAAPVDEVVPMTFEMGSATPAIETLLRSGGKFENPLCRDSIGISTRELEFRTRAYRRTYVFSYGDWTPALIGRVAERLQ